MSQVSNVMLSHLNSSLTATLHPYEYVFSYESTLEAIPAILPMHLIEKWAQ